MVALQAGKSLVVNPLLKLKLLFLETELRLLICVQRFTALIEGFFQECGLSGPAAQAGLFCGLIELYIIRALEELQSV